ncbi:MAG: hypothetical protein IRZ28_07505 [Steroidobacteraceae bacterium]|nr:hypothetical protein [Steroidobacteraceae bacterium]
MNESFVQAFVAGFTGCFRLAHDLVVAVAKAVATVSSDFVNGRTSTVSAKRPHG